MLEQTANGEKAEFLIVMADQADLRGAGALKAKPGKARFVRDALWAKARATQGPALDWLREQKIEHRSYYVVNLIWAKAGLEVAQALAARPDVARIEGNPEIRQNLPQPALESRAHGPGPGNIETPAGIEPGISYTRAPEVWALGYTGQGIVIGAVDTGVRWDHNALKSKYRGWNGTTADHNFNWHDSVHSSSNACGPNSPQPCDNHGQGTHTTGTMVGDDGAGNQIGMAPGAKWITCRAFDDNSGSDAAILECLEFLLAPYPVGGTPEQGDPEKAPDIALIPFSGPAEDFYRPALVAYRAAGIMPVASAGLDGPACGSVNAPARYDESYTVGTLTTGTDSIVTSSSRGPAISGNQPLLKPDLTAPGTDVRSSSYQDMASYQIITGSSMAAAHVAGGVALLWSADPSLRGDIDETERFLNYAAFDISSSQCDPPNPVSPNNVYGYGRLDVKAAVAGGFVVTTTADHDDGTCSPTDCTLREAINAANAGVGDIIRFAPGLMGTIQLSSAPPDLRRNILLQGPGANVLTVRRNTGGEYRIFTVTNAPNTGPNVTLAGLTISNGLPPGLGPIPASGGAIFNDRGFLTVHECVLTGNSSNLGQFSYGGAIFNYEGSLTVDRTTFSGNDAYYGGGIASIRQSVPGAGTITITNSTFTANTAAYGNGLYVGAQESGRVANVNVTHCTFSGNVGSGNLGAGIYNSSALSGRTNLAVSHCTFAENSASQGSSIYNFNSGGTTIATVRNSILASSSGGTLFNNGGSMNSLGYNLSSDNAAGVLSVNGDQTNTPPLLGPLASNGGPTQTHALLSGSPAIDKGLSYGLTTDQRRYSRLIDDPSIPPASGGDNCDIGAFEFGGTPPPVALVSMTSRKIHGGMPFHIDLPLTGSPGVECRSGGASGDHTMIFVFANTVSSVGNASVTGGTGSVSSSSIDADAHKYVVNLTSVSNAQEIVVTLTNVIDSLGGNSANVPGTMAVLVGDTSGNRSVNASDIAQTKGQSGAAVTASNFRTDVNVSGSINASDIGLVKSRSGTALP